MQLQHQQNNAEENDDEIETTMANNGGSVTGLWQAQSNQPIDENRNTLQNIIEESILQERTEEVEEGSYSYDELHNLRNAQEQIHQEELEGDDEVAAVYST